jgi:hypothetical protein
LLAFAASCALLDGCATRAHMGVMPPTGWIFTHYRAPMRLRMGEAASVPCGGNLKQGSTTVRALTLPLPHTFNLIGVGWGDAELDAAARNAGITTIYYADYDWLEVLHIYRRATVHVYGE